MLMLISITVSKMMVITIEIDRRPVIYLGFYTMAQENDIHHSGRWHFSYCPTAKPKSPLLKTPTTQLLLSY